jgi:hypothetical protein
MNYRRITLSLFIATGVALIIAPLSMSMFSRSSNGEKMVNSFRPIMQPAHVATTADYYNNVFTKLRPVALAMNKQTLAKFDAYLAGIKGMQTDAAKLVPALAQALHMSPAQVQQFFAQQFPYMAKMLQSLPQMSRDFGGLMGLMSQNLAVFKRVPPGLDFYKSLVATMQANVNNYASVDALPRMSLFPLFFIIPGILILLAGAYLLVGDFRPEFVWPRLTPKPPATPLTH